MSTAVIEIIKARRNGKSVEVLASEMGLTAISLYRYLAGSRQMSVGGIRKIATWARAKNDQELLAALAAHVLGEPQIEISETLQSIQCQIANLQDLLK